MNNENQKHPLFRNLKAALTRNKPTPSYVPRRRLPIRFDSALEENFLFFAEGCGHDPHSLHELTEAAIRTRHHERRIEHPAHAAHRRRPTVYSIALGACLIYFSYDPDGITVRGYGWDIPGGPLDGYEGGGFYYGC